jgi:hypothetical protein
MGGIYKKGCRCGDVRLTVKTRGIESLSHTEWRWGDLRRNESELKVLDRLTDTKTHYQLETTLPRHWSPMEEVHGRGLEHKII